MRHADEPITMVAGAATGDLGPAVAKRLARAGHHLALIDRRGRRLAALVEDALRDAASVRMQTGDVLNPRRIRHFLDDMLIHYGRVDNVVFVVHHEGPAGGISADEAALEAHLETSVRGPWRWMHAAVPSMQEHDGGRLVFVAPGPGQPAVGAAAGQIAAEAALRTLVEQVALEDPSRMVQPVCLVRGDRAPKTPIPAETWADAVYDALHLAPDKVPIHLAVNPAHRARTAT